MATRRRLRAENRPPVTPQAAGISPDAVEKARLLEDTERRTRELTALLEVSRVVASSLDLNQVLGAILDQLGSIVEHTGSAVLILRDSELEFVDQRSIAGYRTHIGARLRVDDAPTLWRAISSGETVIIDDVRSDDRMAADYRSIVTSGGVSELPPLQVLRSWMGVPLTLKDQAIGMLTISHVVPAHFNAADAHLARAFADHAAIAIQNARLFEQAQLGAALEERQRLARELHDSVSQALYGIALGARTARTLLDRDPPSAVEPVDYVLSLAEVGLAEMRALIFELRPESLENEGLNAAIRKHVEAVQARHGVHVDFLPCEEPDLPLAVKEAVYRIAQESLTNVVKHSQATQVRVRLASTGAGLELEVADNGAGFDTAGDFPGHLGLRSMRERAEKSGGRLEISSQAGVGTRVIATFAVA
jgi:signal transduction histidine kinase